MIGLSLSGGGVKGAYQIGAYYAFKKNHIKFDGYVGTSIGSFNAAMLAAGMEKELLELWQNVNVGEVLGFDQEIADLIKNKKQLKDVSKLAKNFKDIIMNFGLDTHGLRKMLEKYNIEQLIRKSKKDYGLVTVNLTNLKPVYKFIEQIKEGKLNDYIIGSCHFPIFKLEKLVDEKYYIDGGFYDNSPVNMLLDKGYDKIYAIDMSAIGIRRRIKDRHKVIVIKPSRSLGPLFTFNNNIISRNIKLGYYDTLKVINNLDGYKYIFKKYNKWFYKLLIRNVNKKKLEEMEELFNTKDPKKLVIKALEYMMKKENYEYTKVYNPIHVIKKIKRKKYRKYGVYRFICELKLF